jgi:hypothetical protein
MASRPLLGCFAAPVLVALPTLAAGCARSSAPPAADLNETSYDFRVVGLPTGSAVFGDPEKTFVGTGPDGLRIAFPDTRRDTKQVGLILPVDLCGDFEITASFAILHATEPPAGHGVGILVSLNKKARVGRLARAEGEQVVFADLWSGPGNKKQFVSGATLPRQANAGRLRFKRTGPLLDFLWSPAMTGEDFEAVHQCPFGEDIKEVRLVSQTGGQRCALDARFTTLHIRSNDGSAMPAPTTGTGRRLAAAIFCLVLFTAAGTWFWGRRRRNGTQMPSADAAADQGTSRCDAAADRGPREMQQ